MRVDQALMTAAIEGQFDKQELASLLDSEARPSFLHACARIERRFTDACAAQGDHCLASGCSVAGVEGEACLQPLLREALEYRKACGAAWITYARNGERP